MISLFKRYYSIRKLLFFTGETFLLLISLLAVAVYKHRYNISIIYSTFLWIKILFIVFICQISLYYHELYNFKYGFSYLDMTFRLIHALGGACLVLGFIFLIYPRLLPAKWIFLVSLLVFVILSSLWRYAYCAVLKKGLWTTPVLIVGNGDFPLEIIKEVRDNADCGYKIVALAAETPYPQTPELQNINFILGFHSLYKSVLEQQVEAVVVAMDEKRGKLPVKELLELKVNGIPIIEGETFYEHLTGKILVEKINPSWLIFGEGFQKSFITLISKRIVGIILSIIGLILTSPILLLTAILIKIESPGPVFFKQVRVGKDGKNFVLVKFRSMRVDAEKYGAQWAQKNDPRVTKVGRIIRKLRIDEIPQMWNVLKGEMSFVGPRPERPEFVKELAKIIPYYEQRHAVQPGITGWAQISYPYGASIEDAKEKLKYDLYYIKHMSLLFDLYIILKTVKIILFREGAR